MGFHVSAKSCHCYGGHTTLSPIGDGLLARGGSFGDAIKDIAVTLHCGDSGPAKKTLASLLETHNNWHCAHDFSLYGNDTGADLLVSYRVWRKTHKDVMPMRFLGKLAQRWARAAGS